MTKLKVTVKVKPGGKTPIYWVFGNTSMTQLNEFCDILLWGLVAEILILPAENK
jgi:hypothetical protein